MNELATKESLRRRPRIGNLEFPDLFLIRKRLQRRVKRAEEHVRGDDDGGARRGGGSTRLVLSEGCPLQRQNVVKF